MKRHFPLVAMLWLLTACSSGAAPSAEILQIEARDVAFDHTVLSLPAGVAVTVTLTNVGMLEHNWVLVPATIEPAAATTADAVNGAASNLIAGGRSTTLTFTAPTEGSYYFVCTVPGHVAAGMVGRLTVVP